MRKLPVYILVDVSGSMMGEPLEQVKNGIQMLVSALRQDPQALETAFLSVITFGSEAKQEAPLTDLASFQVPNLAVAGATAFGAALALVADCHEREIKQTTREVKGDYRPLVFIMTDGTPTDDWKKGFERFKQKKWGTIICCGVNKADLKMLHEISEITLALDTADSTAMAAFFKWVSASVSTASARIESGGKEVGGLNDLPPPPPQLSNPFGV